MKSLVVEVEDIRPIGVRFTASSLVVDLADGRSLATPLDWYPRLKEASASERERVELSPLGVHWPGIDEDLSVAGMLAGRRSVVRQDAR